MSNNNINLNNYKSMENMNNNIFIKPIINNNQNININYNNLIMNNINGDNK